MRGKVTKCLIVWHVMRITPAYAGKSDFHDAHLRFFEDHPRLCGEKHILFIIGGDCMGITPAYAGKRFEQGDKTYNVHGSPPPMRGKVYPRRQRDAL